MNDGTMRLGQTEVSPTPDVRVHRSSLLKREMPGLDAIRGIAVVSVVLRHEFVAEATDHTIPLTIRIISEVFRFGWLGVCLFFVLSGFLITGILIDTKARENYWRSFYVRRALRILPLYVAVLLLAHFFYGSEWSYILLCLLFLANLIEAKFSHVYNPLWSLAVEEQFYLVWPSLVRRFRLRTLAIFCIVVMVASPLLRGLATIRSLGNPYDATWLISDQLLMGALLAIFLRSQYSSLRNVRRAATALTAITAILFLIGIKFHLFSRASHAGAAFQVEPFIFLFGLLVLLALRFGDDPRVLKLTRILRFYGYISYGLYLLHLMVFTCYDRFFLGPKADFNHLPTQLALLRFAVGFGTATLICYLSRRYVEEYFLRMKERLVAYSPRAAKDVPSQPTLS
jgi:peptidoglycan/LPS O-acetylase OafA/YrhL